MANYYYASGERVPLERDELRVAILPTKVPAADRKDLLEHATRAGGRTLPGSVVVVPRSSLGGPELARLRHDGALQSVYRRGQELMVALPEIRVEFDEKLQHENTINVLAGAPHAVDIIEDSADRLVLQPRSGSAEDALDVANYLQEKGGPAAATVRFVRFIPKPQP